MKQQPFDLAIVGAGPAGSVCACSALAESGNLRVALIDRELFPRDKSCGDAVRGDAIAVLGELGLKHVFSHLPRIERLQAGIPGNFGYLGKLIDFDQYCYHIIERSFFDDSIYRGALDRGAHDLAGYSLVDAAFNKDSRLWTLTLADRSCSEHVLQARGLVGADGASSRVRRIAGLDLNGEKHMAVGIRAYARAEGSDQGALRLDYLEHLIPGYGWTFPLLDNKVNVGVYLDGRDYKSIGMTLTQHLEDYIRYLAGVGIVVENLRDVITYPLPLFQPELPLTPHRQIALIGDAAAMIDPLTGEGIHFGIWAGATLGRFAAEGLQKHDLQAGMENYAEAFNRKFADSMANSQRVRTMLRFQRIMF